MLLYAYIQSPSEPSGLSERPQRLHITALVAHSKHQKNRNLPY